MKWKVPQSCDTRVIKKFAFIPITIDGECRWFEFVTIRQTYRGSRYSRGWDNYYFVD